MKKNFKLFVACFPGGDVYCNSAIMEHGDYKQIAFIDYKGDLKFYIDPSCIPGDILLRIEHDSDTKKANFRSEWNKLPDLKKYEKLLDLSGIGGLLYSHELPCDFTLTDKIKFFEYIVYGWIPDDEKISIAIEKYKNSKYYHKGV